MSYLEKIQRKIYKREEDNEIKDRLDAQDDYTPGKQPILEGQPDTPGVQDYSPSYLMSHKIRRWVLIGLGSAAVIGVVVFGISLLFRETSFSPEKVNVSIIATGGVKSGDPIQLQYLVQNDNPSNIKNVQLALRYPPNSQISKPLPTDGVFQVIPVDTLKGKSSINIIAEAIVFGADQQFLTVQGDLTYNAGPTGKNRFTQNVNHGFYINGAPITFGLACPRVLTSGQLIACTVEYDNTSEEVFQDVRIKVDYPSEFTLSSTSPEPTLFDNTWVIPLIDANRRGNVKFEGRLAPFDGKPPVFKAQLEIQDPQGVYFSLLRDEYGGEITDAPLVVRQFPIDDEDRPINMVSPGQEVIWNIEYENTSESAVRNVVIESFIDLTFFDASSVKTVDNGVFYASEGKIVWDNRRKADLNFLEPLRSGVLGFEARVKNNISRSRKNVTGAVTTTITTPTAPVELAGLDVDYTDTLSLPLTGVMQLRATTSQGDQPFQNFGPAQPVTGVDSSYTITWELSTAYADMEDVEVTTTLPLEIRWSNLVFPTGERIEHNPITGIVSWTIPKVPAGTGYQNPPRMVQFQIVVNPGPGGNYRLERALGRASAQATDDFSDIVSGASAEYIRL